MNRTAFSRSGRHFLQLAAALTLGFALVTPAQAEFQGGGALHDFNGCEAYGLSGAEPIRARYSPGERTGETASQISFFWPSGGAFNLTGYRDFDPTRQWFRAGGHGMYGGIYSWTPRPRIKILERSVLDPTGGAFGVADIIFMRIRIRHFDGLANCQLDADLMLHWVD